MDYLLSCPDTVEILFLGMMINFNPSIDDGSVLGNVANVSVQKKKDDVSAFGNASTSLCQAMDSSLIALVHRSLRKGSLINFL
jgi:hypothetical protein